MYWVLRVQVIRVFRNYNRRLHQLRTKWAHLRSLQLVRVKSILEPNPWMLCCNSKLMGIKNRWVVHKVTNIIWSYREKTAKVRWKVYRAEERHQTTIIFICHPIHTTIVIHRKSIQCIATVCKHNILNTLSKMLQLLLRRKRIRVMATSVSHRWTKDHPDSVYLQLQFLTKIKKTSQKIWRTKSRVCNACLLARSKVIPIITKWNLWTMRRYHSAKAIMKAVNILVRIALRVEAMRPVVLLISTRISSDWTRKVSLRTTQTMDVNNHTVKVGHRIGTLDPIKECSWICKQAVALQIQDSMSAVINRMMSSLPKFNMILEWLRAMLQRNSMS